MNTKRVVLFALILLLLAGCGGAKYAQEKTLLATVTKAMDAFSSSMATVESPQDVAKIIGTFTGQIEKVLPKMKELTDTHPEWEDNPPKELEKDFAKFKSASTKFKDEAMPKVMQFAQQHADNPELQTALQKFSGLMSQL